MGQVKDQWMEDMERGFSIPTPNSKFICSNHFEDIYLKEFVAKNSHQGECSYCHKRCQVIDFSVMVQFIAEKILSSFSNPDGECLPLTSSFYDDEEDEIPGLKRVGPYVALESSEQFDSTEELLSDLDITDDSVLLRDIAECFNNDNWIKTDPMVISKSQELSYKWESFENMVKHERRFTFFDSNAFSGKVFSTENGLQDILTELKNIIATHKIIRTLNQGTTIYRCRFLDPSEKIAEFNEITSAPSDRAKQSRMSPAGVSMFYGAFKLDLAIRESSNDGKGVGYYAYGKFVTKQDLRILDLTTLPICSFWMEDDYQGLGFLYSFRKIISKSIKRDDKIHIEYIPSQVFTEYIRYSYGEHIDGIIYGSSLDSNGQNIVLFYDRDESEKILDMVNIKHKTSKGTSPSSNKKYLDTCSHPFPSKLTTL